MSEKFRRNRFAVSPEGRRIEQERIEHLQANAPKGFMYVPKLGMYVTEGLVARGENWDNQKRISREEGGRVEMITEFKKVAIYTKENRPEIYNQIMGQNGLQGERFYAEFDKEDGEFYIITPNGIEKVHKRNLIEDRVLGISLDSWLNDNSKQGLPHKKIDSGKLNFWSPKEGAVARFYADPFRSGLGCEGHPLYSNSFLGVRVVREAA